MKTALCLLAGFFMLGLTSHSNGAQDATQGGAGPYPERIAAWRAKREEGLKREGGWLSVAGLHWLKEGENTIGAGTGNDFVLPAGSAPQSVGVITLRGGKASARFAAGVTATVNGRPTVESELRTDANSTPDRVKIGGLTFTIIQRGARTGIRLWDNNAAGRKNFTGLKWYPVNEAYRIPAKFIPYNPPRKVAIRNILGDTEEGISPGYVTFVLNGREYRLETQEEGNSLFINFKDRTSGNATYPPGRFLTAPKPENGQTVLDFNQAYNPPCAFTAFATCPLPPAQNRLNVVIEAGEKRYHVADEDFVPAGLKINFAEEVAAFVKADKENPPKGGQILFYGASIFRQWRNLPEQLAPLPVLNRGFGGARTWEALYYADRIALPYEPKVIVYYAAANDINAGEKPEAILERYRQFSDKVTERLPDTKLYFLAIFRAPQKKDRWDTVDAANRLIRDYSAKTNNRGFIDANSIVFDKNGQPRTEFYQPDGLHFTDSAYVALSDFLRPLLQQAWSGQTADAK